MALPRKRIRARRARARQRERLGLDLRGRYRPGDLPAAPDLAVVEFEDAFDALDPGARQQQARRADGSVAEGAPEWAVPPRPKVRAVARLKEDPLGRMHARRQLDRALFLGGREYQRLFDGTQIGLVRSIDWSKTKVSGGRHPDPLTDARQRASKQLRHADDVLLGRHGMEGLSLVRDVLCERRSVEAAGRARGAVGEKEIRWFGVLLRKCLALLAAQFGFSTSSRPPRPVRLNGGEAGVDGSDLSDPSRHADAAELDNPALRRGRPNGGGT